MYSLGELRRGIARGLKNPSYFARELNHLYYSRLGYCEYNPDGVDLMEADWDTLVILDACRYDSFAARHNLPGRLERRESRGSHTTEFLKANFDEGQYSDTVYVTASPQLHRNRDELDASFHSVVHAWRETDWDDEYGTVLPSTMTKRALEAHERYPKKRIIVHYLQPHYPFIGASAELNTRQFGQSEDTLDIWGNLMRGNLDVSPERIRRAYEENLDIVLEAIEPLLSDLDGRIVVSSDHGNIFGSRARPIPIREWGHPPGIYLPELVEVPWLTYDAGPRRTIVEGEIQAKPEKVEEETIENRLQELGYV